MPIALDINLRWARELGCNGKRRSASLRDDEGWQKVKPYLAEHPINYPIVLGNPELAKPYQITGMPVTVLIDRNGNIAEAHVGIVVKEEWEGKILMLLKEKAK